MRVEFTIDYKTLFFFGLGQCNGSLQRQKTIIFIKFAVDLASHRVDLIRQRWSRQFACDVWLKQFGPWGSIQPQQ
jgi:hypothetical protein